MKSISLCSPKLFMVGISCVTSLVEKNMTQGQNCPRERGRAGARGWMGLDCPYPLPIVNRGGLSFRRGCRIIEIQKQTDNPERIFWKSTEEKKMGPTSCTPRYQAPVVQTLDKVIHRVRVIQCVDFVYIVCP